MGSSHELPGKWGRKISMRVYRWFSWYTGTIQKWTVTVQEPCPGIALKTSDKGISYQWAEFWLFILSGRRDGQRYRSILVDGLWLMGWALANGLAGWSENWKEYNWKIGDKKVWGRNKWVDPSNSVQSVKMFVSHVNGHQGHWRVTLAEEDFIIQVDKMTCLVDTRRLSFSDTLVICHRHGNQAAVLEGM